MTTWQYMRRLVAWKRVEFLWNALAWGVFHLIPLAYGLLVKGIFDALSKGESAGANAWTLLAILATAYASRQAAFLCGFRLFSRYYLSVEAFLRRNLLDYLMRARGSRVLPESPSESVSRFRDDVNDIAAYSESWIDFGGFVLYGVAAIGLLLYTDALIATLVSTPLLGMTLVMRRLSPVIRSYRRRMREATARVTGFIGEAFAAAQAVKVAGQEESVTAHFRTLGDERRKRALADVLLTEMIRGVNNGLVYVGIGLVLTLAAAKLRSGTFTVGDLALFIQLLPRVTSVLTFVGDVMAQHRRVKVATDRMERLLVDAPPGQIMDPRPIELTGPMPRYVPEAREGEPLETVEVRNLTFRYPASEAGVSNINFQLRRGDFVVITGRIGSGKTTLLRVLQGLLPNNSGEVLWNGRVVEDPATFFTPPHSSYTAQVPRLFSESLRDNVLFGEPAEDRLAPAMDLAAMGPDLAALENGLDTLVGTRGVKLSGGQIQRASAARMFARGADLLIFDDLSSALDVATEQQLWESLFREREATCLVVSHRRLALRRATKVLLMSQGSIAGQGRLGELIESSAEMRRLWEEEEEEEGRGPGNGAPSTPAR
ncbi:MAG: ABC transporter ATP-binding protein [Acidobacteria bacterium]|nr:ABC transporter ATP-binding protein [Acidobacteriota bacterium]